MVQYKSSVRLSCFVDLRSELVQLIVDSAFLTGDLEEDLEGLPSYSAALRTHGD